METKQQASVALAALMTLAVAVDGRCEENYPKMPQMVTSFGAAVTDGHVYYYGGHTGGAHSYSLQEQGNSLWSLDLDGGKWKQLATGPHLQGLALVAHGGNLYRLGGFTARNAAGEEHDLWSQDSVAEFDPKIGTWRDFTPLPEPRSSFDAAVMDNKIYVVGGWCMAGDKDSDWHDTAHVIDLTAETPHWKPLPKPPFRRRALSVAAFENKIYAIGGMQQQGGPTTRVDVFDVATGKWSRGPSLVGKGMDGFGSSAFATGGRLYVTTYSGQLQRLAQDAASWEVIRTLPTARFFHRLLPLAENRLLQLGGADMKIGKFDELETIHLNQ